MTTSNINCEAFDEAFSGYLEGTLDPSVQESVDRHLGGCLRCARLVKDVEAIQADARALPDLALDRDLWAGLEARIAAPVIPFGARPERVKSLSPAWLGAAAAALVMATAGVTYLVTAHTLAPATGGRVAAATTRANPGGTLANPAGSADQNQPAATTDPTPSPATGSEASRRLIPEAAPSARAGSQGLSLASRDPDAGSSHSEAVYGKEIEMLQKIVSERRTQLDPATVAIIEKNLRIIDGAIAQSRAALVKDPASLLLSDQLSHALDKKVELLRTAALLPAST
jgi:hypothetical protein